MESYSEWHLPEEMVDEILLRLPVKALLVCKCVCKEWCAHIKSPSFVNRHFSHESNHDCLLFQVMNSAVHDVENQYAFVKYEDEERHSRVEESQHLPYIPTDSRLEELQGPENGVFCVMSRYKRIGLLNPAMREFKALPPHPVHDYSEISTLIGFGLDKSSGDFKVVVVEPSEYQNFAYVYSLSSVSWKIIETVKDVVFLAGGFDNSRILNGFKHWFIWYRSRNSYSILAFHMSSEKFQDIPIPNAITRSFTRSRDRASLTEYCGSIAVMSFEWDVFLDLWVMGSDGLWSKSYSINGPFQELVRPLCVWCNHKVAFGASSSPLTIVPLEDPHNVVCGHYIYKESLVSIKGEKDQADCVEDLYWPCD